MGILSPGVQCGEVARLSATDPEAIHPSIHLQGCSTPQIPLAPRTRSSMSAEHSLNKDETSQNSAEGVEWQSDAESGRDFVGLILPMGLTYPGTAFEDNPPPICTSLHESQTVAHTLEWGVQVQQSGCGVTTLRQNLHHLVLKMEHQGTDQHHKPGKRRRLLHEDIIVLRYTLPHTQELSGSAEWKIIHSNKRFTIFPGSIPFSRSFYSIQF